MRTLTDVSSKLRQVEVELTAGELAARLGYTGLTATHVVMEGGIVRVHMQNVREANDIPHSWPWKEEQSPICDECWHDLDIDENSHY